MPELSTQESGDITPDLPQTFNALAERWPDLIECQKAMALGIIWNLKKQIILPDGERVGLTEKQFIKRTAAIVDEEREVISVIFREYKDSQPAPESPPKRVKCTMKVDAPVAPIGDRVRNEKSKKPSGKRGRPRKKPANPKKVPQIRPVPKEVVERFTRQPSLTPEQIREINRKIHQQLGKVGVC